MRDGARANRPPSGHVVVRARSMSTFATANRATLAQSAFSARLPSMRVEATVRRLHSMPFERVIRRARSRGERDARAEQDQDRDRCGHRSRRRRRRDRLWEQARGHCGVGRWKARRVELGSRLDESAWAKRGRRRSGPQDVHAFGKDGRVLHLRERRSVGEHRRHRRPFDAPLEGDRRLQPRVLARLGIRR